MADELVQAMLDQFSAAAERYVELLEEAEGRVQANRQPHLESIGASYIFRTEPRHAGLMKVIRRQDGSVDGQAMAWHDAPITKIDAVGDRAYIEAGNNRGSIERNSNQNVVLASEHYDEPPVTDPD